MWRWALAVVLALMANGAADAQDALQNLTAPHDYVQKRISSYDRSGGNADALEKNW